MNEMKHLKCPCQKCGGPIAFPAHGIGTAVSCPHCDQTTQLFAPTLAFDSNADPRETVSPSQNAATDYTASAQSESLSNSSTPAEHIRGGQSALKSRLLWPAS